MNSVPPAFTLRSATVADIDALYAIHRAGMREYVEATYGPWDEPWQYEAFATKYADVDSAPTYSLEVVIVADEIAGYLHTEHEPGYVLLANIRVAARWQRRGLGSALVERVIEQAAPLPVELAVLRVNPARALYERLRFHVIEESDTHLRMRRGADAT